VNSTQKQCGPFFFWVASRLLISFLCHFTSFFDAFFTAYVSRIRGPITYSAVEYENIAQTSQRSPCIFMFIILRFKIWPNVIDSFVAQDFLEGIEVVLKTCQMAFHVLKRLIPSTISETLSSTSAFSTILPVTIIFAPADAAANACPLDLMPPPTIRGTSM